MDKSQIRKIVVETIAEYNRIPFISVGVSNRHIHLSQEDLEILFGTGYQLTYTKELMPGQYACQETVEIQGSKGKLQKVRVLGPVRSQTQLEISLTDSFALGVSAPVNESGNLTGAAKVGICNPQTGAVVERCCAIAALRHIHLTPDYAEKHNLQDKQIVSVEFNTRRGIIFPNVLLRISPDFRDQLHIDIDEANAGEIKTGDIGKILV